MASSEGGIEAELASDLESSLINLEQSFFNTGFQGGVVHGRLHGLFEGRSLGKDHAWQLGEEVGFYHGFAVVWAHLLAAQDKAPTRATTNLQQILSLSSSFPLQNNSSAPVEQTLTAKATPLRGSDVDISAMLSSQRVKYRAACAALGVRPRIIVASAGANSNSGRSVGL
ncbi:BQ2448_3395 [Microbotryum intermedium]|uniref:BQ2448_3395 protein n=1 Tax=Microbotryum intermedium TaxID=269621 RepID=A0A238FF56_9BASI|nr:BQ2448_3395 [Microbotryum intermedium]